MCENSFKSPCHNGSFGGLTGEVKRVGLCAGAGMVSADESILGHTPNDGWFDDAMEVVDFKVEVGANRDLEVSENLDFDTIGARCYDAL